MAVSRLYAAPVALPWHAGILGSTTGVTSGDATDSSPAFVESEPGWSDEVPGANSIVPDGCQEVAASAMGCCCCGLKV